MREHATEEDTDGGAEPAHRAPHAERPGAVAVVGEGGGEDRQAGRGHQRRADALGDPGADQHAGVRREPAGQRAQCEQGRAGDKDTSAAEQVRGPAAE